jgi:formylglycine-generating enzyme required for sulfatase activity
MKYVSKIQSAVIVSCLVAGGVLPVRADITIATRAVDNVGNLADTTTELGAVDYRYRIATYEVTNTQYAAFLTAKAAVSDTNNLYNADMGGQFGGITQTGSSGSYTYAVKDGFALKPVNYVSFWDATRFTNWLSNGQGIGSTETGSYTLTNETISNNTVTRNVGAAWVVPTASEWYKAAYYDPNKPSAVIGADPGGYWQRATKSDSLGDNAAFTFTNGANYHDSANNDYANGSLSGSGTTDVGSYSIASSYFGTFDQGGNVTEWNEGINGGSRGLRGGSWADGADTLLSSLSGGGLAAAESSGTGFRVASQPFIWPNPPRPNLGDAAYFALLSNAAITTDGIDLGGSIYKKVGTKNTLEHGGFWTANGITSGIDHEGSTVSYTGENIHFGDPLAVSAYNDASAAYDSTYSLIIAGLTSSPQRTEVILGELSGKTFTHGMYYVDYAAAITVLGDFTLDGGGNPDSVFIFYSGAAFSTAADTTGASSAGTSVKMRLTNGAIATNVFWIVNDAFSTGADAKMGGIVISKTGAASTGADNTFEGQFITLTGSITTGAGLKMAAIIPEPSTYGLVLLAVGLGAMMRRRSA